jgi:hypothetical protein
MDGRGRTRWVATVAFAGLVLGAWTWRLPAAGASVEMGGRGDGNGVEVGESVDGAPGHVPPGELEVRVAVSRPETVSLVAAILPGGARRTARYDADSHVWTARFFVDRGTAPGRYAVRVDVVDSGGKTETMDLPYTIDADAPLLSASLRQVRRDPAEFQIAVRGRQVSHVGTPTGADASLFATARHVEVRTPEGRLMTLSAPDDDGRAFRGGWTSRRPAGEVLRLRVIAVDRALGEHVADLTFPLPRVALAAQRLASLR